MMKTVSCHRCNGIGTRKNGVCYTCDGKGTLNAKRVAYLIDVAIPEAMALYSQTRGKEGLPRSLAMRLLEPLQRQRRKFTP